MGRTAATALALLTGAVIFAPAAHAQTPPDTTAPTVATPTLTPQGPAQYGGVSGGVEHQVNGTGIGTWYTNPDGVQVHLSATDNVGVDHFQYRVGTTGDFTTIPATPQGGTTATAVTPPITTQGNNRVYYQAVDAAGNASPATANIAVPYDTVPPTATFTGVTDDHVGHSQIITPARTDPSPGSGGAAVRDAWIDGRWTYPLPLDASTLSLGEHTWTLGLSDVAGNGNKVTETFVVTTSFDDIDAMLTRYQTAGTISADTAAGLHDLIAAAKTANDQMDRVTALADLSQFTNLARSSTTGDAQALLVTDSQDVTRQVRGTPAPPEPRDLGVTQVAYPGPPQHLFKTPAAPSHNPNATFKVLVIGPKNDGSYRHESIEDAEVMIQKLGQENGFDVDVWDPIHPDVSTPDTPFTSAANLAQYAAIIGDSSVGNNTFNSAYTMKDGTVVNEQAAFQGYIENGGGYVSLHGADDSMHNWQWYKDMLGGLFVSHPSNASGFAPNCGSCYNAELDVEDPSNPAIAGQPRKIRIQDELYHFDRKPRPYGHPILDLNESTYATALGVNSRGSLENGDHPISWCTMYDGGRVFAQVLGHNYDLFTTPWFVNYMKHAILWAAGKEQMNCVTHREVQSLIAADQTAGTLTADAASAASAAVQSAMDKYMTLTQAGYSDSLDDIATLERIARDPASGDAAARATLLAKATQLKDWMHVLLGCEAGGGQGGGPADGSNGRCVHGGQSQ